MKNFFFFPRLWEAGEVWMVKAGLIVSGRINVQFATPSFGLVLTYRGKMNKKKLRQEYKHIYNGLRTVVVFIYLSLTTIRINTVLYLHHIVTHLTCVGMDRHRHVCLTTQLPCLGSTDIFQIISSKDQHCRSF